MIQESSLNTELKQDFQFSKNLKKNLLFFGILSILLIGIGIFQLSQETAHTQIPHTTEAEHLSEVTNWVKVLWVDLWVNNIFFTGIAIIGIFFVAIQYVAKAGWASGFIRIPLSFGNFLIVSLVFILGVFWLGSGSLFHWTHQNLYDISSTHYDPILAGKQSFLNTPFYILRTLIFLVVWILFFLWIKKMSLQEDKIGGVVIHRKIIRISVMFLVFFAVSSSIAAWDWVMSIDPHWFSTMFGWYVFSSWFISGLSAITLILILLQQAGYLHFLNESHLHDMGKYIFGFSVFWTYIWFSQFLLIYYANLPEESIYFLERLTDAYYFKYFVLIIIFNFFFPFLVLMTRDAKRKIPILKIVCIAVLIGHWLDFYLMIAPGVLNKMGNFGFLELGTILFYTVLFVLIFTYSLSRMKMVPKNHPMLKECLYHHS